MSLEIPPIRHLVHDGSTRNRLPTSTFPDHAARGLSIKRGNLTLHQMRHIKISIIVMDFLDYSSGYTDQLPCDFSIIHRIQSLWAGRISLGSVLDVGAQIIFTARACAEYLELLGCGQYIIEIPLGKVILCTAKLYTNARTCIRNINRDEDVCDTFFLGIILLKSIFSSIFCLAQIIFYFYISQLAVPLQLFLIVTLYLISVCEILSTEYYATLSTSRDGIYPNICAFNIVA